MPSPDESLSPEAERQHMAYCFAKQAFVEGLDTQMKRETWGAAGSRLFGALFEQALAALVCENVREVLDIGDVRSVHEIAQLLTMTTGINFETEKRVHGIDWALALEPKSFERRDPQHCTVKQTIVKTIWRRIA